MTGRPLAAAASAALLTALAGSPGGPPPAAAQTALAPGVDQRSGPPERPVIVDGGGREVGPVVGLFFGRPLVRLRAGGHDASIVVSDDRLLSFADAAADYETLNCTGPPLIQEPVAGFAGPLLESLPVGAVNELLAPTGAPVTRTLNSFWKSNSTPPACIPRAFSETAVVRETTVVIDLDLFVPPFRLR